MSPAADPSGVTQHVLFKKVSVSRAGQLRPGAGVGLGAGSQVMVKEHARPKGRGSPSRPCASLRVLVWAPDCSGHSWRAGGRGPGGLPRRQADCVEPPGAGREPRGRQGPEPEHRGGSTGSRTSRLL